MASFKRQLCLTLEPVDHLEKHSAFEHFGFEIGGCLANAEARFAALFFGCVVGSREPRIASYIMIRLSLVNAGYFIGPLPYEKAVAGVEFSDGPLRTHGLIRGDRRAGYGVPARLMRGYHCCPADRANQDLPRRPAQSELRAQKLRDQMKYFRGTIQGTEPYLSGS